MVDAKSILEDIVRGAAPSQTGQQPGRGLGDIINSVLKGGQNASGGGRGLADVLNEIGKSIAPPKASPAGSAGAAQQSARSDDLAALLEEIKGKLAQAGGAVTDGGGLGDVLGKIIGQAAQGVKEGSARIGEATGASDALGRLASDPDAAQLLAKIKEFARENPFAAGATAGGLGGLVLGTRTGRSLAAGATRIGAIAMIGGLAYKALQNYQAGKPLITGASAPEAAPAGSGFEPAAATNETALLIIQAMIAAAAADGRIDAAEHDRLISSLKQAGFDQEAEAFLAKELSSPRSVQDLARAVSTPEQSVQVYTAARVAVSVGSAAEQEFLSSLANALKLDPKLVAEIDATAKNVAA